MSSPALLIPSEQSRGWGGVGQELVEKIKKDKIETAPFLGLCWLRDLGRSCSVSVRTHVTSQIPSFQMVRAADSHHRIVHTQYSVVI